MQASRLCNADPAGLFPTPGDSFSGETASQSAIFTSINANVVSSQMLSRSIFPPTFPCAPQNPLAVGSSGYSSTAHHPVLYGLSVLIQCVIHATQEIFSCDKLHIQAPILQQT